MVTNRLSPPSTSTSMVCTISAPNLFTNAHFTVHSSPINIVDELESSDYRQKPSIEYVLLPTCQAKGICTRHGVFRVFAQERSIWNPRRVWHNFNSLNTRKQLTRVQTLNAISSIESLGDFVHHGLQDGFINFFDWKTTPKPSSCIAARRLWARLSFPAFHLFVLWKLVDVVVAQIHLIFRMMRQEASHLNILYDYLE